MKLDHQLINIIKEFMQVGDQWKSAYTIDLMYHVWARYVDFWPDGLRMEFLDEHGKISKHMMKKGPNPETILRHRRKVKADHNKQVATDGMGIYWLEGNERQKEEETINEFTKQ